jgi:hypothetical protein
MAYRADKSVPVPSADELRARIPGWGADLDHADRPSTPKEDYAPDKTGAHWDFPERQEPHGYRERSIEHAFLTPVFGTAQPLHGVSGMIRRFAYERYSEARAAHWLLLVAADRVEAIGAHVRSLASGRPDDPISESGVLGEFRRRPISSRFGRGRADLAHTWLDPILVVGPWLVAGWVIVRIVRAAVRRTP